MTNIILGVIGPWQIIFLLLILGLVIGGLVLLLTSRAKHKSKAKTLESVIDSSTSKVSEKKDDNEKFDKLERLNKLKQDGALTEEEFNREKSRILGE